MSKVETLLQEAGNDFRTADHLVYINQTMMGGNKILLYIAKKLHSSCLNAIDALLFYERTNRRLSFTPTEFSSKISIFESEVVPRFRLSSDVVETINELHSVLNEHEESPMEFSRTDKFVICSEGYETVRTLDINNLKSYMNTIRSFLYSVNEVTKNV